MMSRGSLDVGDCGVVVGLRDLSRDVVDMVTPTRPLSLSTSAFRFVPDASAPLFFLSEWLLSRSLWVAAVVVDGA